MVYIYLLLIIIIIIISIYSIIYTKNIINYRYIDVVYTWVNGSDEKLILNRNKYKKYSTSLSIDSLSLNRYRDNLELKYSIRSIQKHVKWVNNIYIVTDNQIPEWLNTNNSQIHIIDHTEIFQNKNHLPSFNSNAIECNIPFIKGLSNYYIYMNDDFFFGKNIDPSFFIKNRYINFNISSIKNEDYLYKSRHQNIYKYQLYKNFEFLKSIGYKDKVYMPIHQATMFDKNLYIEFLNKYKKIYESTSSAKIRNKETYHINGIMCIYQLMKKKSIIVNNIDSLVVSITDDIDNNFVEFSLIKVYKPTLYCINDDIKNKTDIITNQYKIFFENILPIKSDYEK